MSAALFSLAGKTALVTGGTRGIGQAQAIALAEAGADVILVKGNSPIDATRAGVEAAGRKCHSYQCDLLNKEEVAKLVGTITKDHKVDILINVAGIQRRCAAEDFPMETFEEVMQINLSATFVLCRDIGKYWITNGIKGKIINTASLATFLGNIKMLGYAMSKGGVGQLTKALAVEWAPKGINVNAIAPGYIATDMNIDTRTGDPAYYQSLTDRIPAGRWGKPDDFKGPTVFLASDASEYVNGHILLVDGGYLVR